jgi:hypothetical protein
MVKLGPVVVDMRGTGKGDRTKCSKPKLEVVPHPCQPISSAAMATRYLLPRSIKHARYQKDSKDSKRRTYLHLGA